MSPTVISIPWLVGWLVVLHGCAGGVLELNAENDPELFKMARVGLGCLGVVTELTLKVRKGSGVCMSYL